MADAVQASNDGAGGEPFREKVRVQRGVRDQIEMIWLSLDQRLPGNHFVRAVAAAVRKLNLAPFYDVIKARQGHVGRTPVDPAILITLIVTATLEGISHDRRIARLCERDIVYQWICGGVSLNHHLLSDFRSADPERLEQVIVGLVAVLLEKGLVELTRTAQDGMRVRASAGSSSFKKLDRLQESLEAAQKRYEELQQERAAAEENPQSDVSDAQAAARERAAREKIDRIEEALKQLPDVQARMEKRKKGDGEKARCSTTDPDARRMKMADGGTRPAYNVQLCTTDKTRIIVGWDVNNAGSDSGLMSPMQEQLQEHYGRRSDEHLTDGGFSSNADIEEVESHETTVYSPVKAVKNKEKKGIDPYAPVKGDSPTIASWRQRMGTEAAQAIYKLRSSIAEFPNAVFRNNGLRQFGVRGLPKVTSTTLWQVLSYDISRILSLGWLNQLEDLA